MESKRTLNDYTMYELLDMWKKQYNRSNTFVQFCTKLEEKWEKESETFKVQEG